MKTVPKPTSQNWADNKDPTKQSSIVPPWLTELLPHMRPKSGRRIMRIVEDWRKVTGK